MKNSIRGLTWPAILAAVILGPATASCNKIPSEERKGTLIWNFSPGMSTRSATELPDTDSFILTVRNSSNTILYQGPYGSSPESLLVDPGTYTVDAVSREFQVPEFDAPQFGDEQVVVVGEGTCTRAVLDCSQLNCGLRLRIDPDFPARYPGGSLSVVSPEGSLVYGTAETRTGFFKPGNLSVCLNVGGKSERLVSRNVEAREILSLGITCPSSQGPSADQGTAVSIVVDTMRTWSEEEYTIGSGENDGTTASGAYSVGRVKEHAGEKGVWVCGYIVGGDLSSSKGGIKFEPPFTSMTCIALASRSSVTDKASCVSVQLAKGKAREELNLVDHPELLGRKIYLKGDLEASYYGIPGIKNLTEYYFN